MDKTEITINAYDQNAKEYAEKFMDFELYNKRINEFALYIKNGSKVLDLGCGPGNILKIIREKLDNVVYTGIDLSKELLKMASSIDEEGIFICEDLRSIELGENEFDIVIMSFCIIHLQKEEVLRLIDKVSKSMKSKAKLYISFMAGKDEGYESTSFSKDLIYYNYYSEDEIRKALLNKSIITFHVKKQDYKEEDGSLTTDIFIFGEKK